MKRKSVQLPDRTVTVKMKSGTYVYLTKEVKYSVEHKKSSPVRIAIGKLDDKGMLIPNNNYFDLFGYQDEIIDASDRSDVIVTGPHFIVQRIAEKLQLDILLQETFGDNADKILDIATYMMMSENNVMQYFEDYGYNHFLFHKDNFSDNTIGELFSQMKVKQIDLFIKAWVNLRANKEIYISYDSTNMNCVAGDIELSEYGHAKDNEELPQVNVSLGYDQTNGSPLFYELYPGSIIDNVECAKMVERAKTYGVKGIGFILDRGYFSRKNIRYFENNGYDYIIMAKSNAKFLEKVIEESSPALKRGYKNYIDEYELYGTTSKQKLFETDKTQYVHVYYNGVESENEKIIINRRFKGMDDKLEELKNKKIKRKEDMEYYRKYYRLKYDNNGYFLNYQRKDEEIQKLIDKAGYFVIISSKEMTAQEALGIYRDRDAVEKIFRMEKTYLGNDVFRVHSNEKLESKVFVSFVALIIRNEIYKAMKPLYAKNRKEYTVPKVLRDLERMYLTKLSDGKYHSRYTLTKKQKNILKEIGTNETEYNKYIEKIKSVLN